MAARRVTIPPAERELGVNLELSKWKYPEQVFFHAIDSYHEVLGSLPYAPIDKDDDDEPDSSEVVDTPDFYVTVLRDLINKENSLLGHVTKLPDVAIEKNWPDFLTAAAWRVVQDYVRACGKGAWGVGT